MDVFIKQMDLIKDLGYEFYNPKDFINEFKQPKNKKNHGYPSNYIAKKTMIFKHIHNFH